MYTHFVNILAKNANRLPGGYTEVKYIEALDGNSYVLSGIVAASCKSAYIKMQYISGRSTYGLFGSSWQLTGFVLAFNNVFQFYSNNSYYNVQGLDLDGLVHEVYLEPTAGTSPNNNNIIKIFNAGNTGMFFRIWHLIWYGDDGTITAEFIPCYRNSDNTCGFYDVKNGSFRAGTGNFAYEEL